MIMGGKGVKTITLTSMHDLQLESPESPPSSFITGNGDDECALAPAPPNFLDSCSASSASRSSLSSPTSCALPPTVRLLLVLCSAHKLSKSSSSSNAAS